MGYMVPPVVEAVMKLEVGEGLEVPVVQRDKCNWSNQINEKLTALKVPIKVRQRTYKGVTTLWRVK